MEQGYYIPNQDEKDGENTLDSAQLDPAPSETLSEDITEVKESEIGEAKKEKEKACEGINEKERAQNFWETTLQNEVRIETPQDPNCEFAIVVPVYNEKSQRILKQIESLRNQQDVDLSEFEIIYVVNNDIPSENQNSQDVTEANQTVIEGIQNIAREDSNLNVYVIDKSSPGNEIEQCNVGKARNRGIAEASLRFYENKKNGVLIQTDADTYFNDPDYLAKLKNIVHLNPDAIGIAGGAILEFSPDAESEEEKRELQNKVEIMLLQKKWNRLVYFLRNPDNSTFFEDNIFFGANMISKSYESAVVGGINDTNSDEDIKFGRDLENYAAGRGQRVIEVKDELNVVTALRESDRTSASFKKVFSGIDINRPLMVSNPFAKETLPEFRDRIGAILEKSIPDAEKFREVLTDSSGDLIVADDSYNNLIDYVRQNGFKIDDDFCKQWITENIGEGYELTHQLYDVEYPQIPLTEENYRRLVDFVAKEPNGTKVIKQNQVLENIIIT